MPDVFDQGCDVSCRIEGNVHLSLLEESIVRRVIITLQMDLPMLHD